MVIARLFDAVMEPELVDAVAVKTYFYTVPMRAGSLKLKVYMPVAELKFD
jgi:hypothetical protein